MLGRRDVQVDGHPIRLGGFRPRLAVVSGIAEPQVIPTRPRPLGHGVGFAFCRFAGFRVGRLDPIDSTRQGRLTVSRRLVFIQVRKHHRQILHGDRLDGAVFQRD